MNLFRLDQVCEINPPKDIKNLSGMEISFVPMEAVSTEGRVDTSRSISGDKVKSYSVFKNRDVLFAKITPCMENGKGGIVNNLKNGYGAGSTEFIVIRPDETKVTSEWIKMFLSQTSFRYDCRNNMTGSAGQKRVPPKFLASKTIPVPSLEDQRRIVAKIEELFSQLDSGVETLKKTKAQLAVYRQAVLKEAFANSWKCVPISELCDCIVPNRDKPKSFSGKIKWITTPDLSENNIYINYQSAELGLTEEEIAMYKAKIIPVGSVIMTCVGKFGISAIVKEPIVINQQLHAFLPCKDIDSRFLAYYIKYRKQFFEKKATATTIKYLNKTNCNSMPFPVLQISVQKELVKGIESQLSVCDSIEKNVDEALQQAEGLRQSILKKAFEGEI